MEVKTINEFKDKDDLLNWLRSFPDNYRIVAESKEAIISEVCEQIRLTLYYSNIDVIKA